jgi:phage major head subunit gpT-like protein
MSYNEDLAQGLANINTTFELMADELFKEKLPGNYELYTDIMPTTTETMEMDWIGETPLMREWLGAKIIEGMRSYLHTLILSSYEATTSVRRKSITYGRVPAIQKRLGQFLQQQAGVYNYGSIAKLITNPTGYDGVSIFSASHPFAADGGTFSNYSTNSLTEANYETARIAMQSYKTEKGRDFEIVPDTIIVGPALEGNAKRLFKAEDRLVVVDQSGSEATSFVVAAGRKSNIWQGELQVVVEPRLTGSYAYYWILLDTSKPGIKPVIIMEGRKPEPLYLTDMSDPERFWFDRYVYSVEGDFSFNAGFWQTAYGNLATS